MPVGSLLCYSCVVVFVGGCPPAFRVGIEDGNAPVHFRSTHSWLGLAAVLMYCLQWLIGVISFLLPVLNKRYSPACSCWLVCPVSFAV